MRVEIWSDFNCPFCYLGTKRFDEAVQQFRSAGGADVDVVYRAFELDPAAPQGQSRPVVSYLANKYGMSAQQAQANEDRLAEQAGEMGLGYRTQDRDLGNSFDLHRLTHFAATTGREQAMVDALFGANFADEESVFADPQRLVAVAAAAGFDADEVRAVLKDPTAFADEVRADEAQAQALGVTGVPFFVFDRKYAVSGAQPTEAFTRALTQAAAPE